MFTHLTSQNLTGRVVECYPDCTASFRIFWVYPRHLPCDVQLRPFQAEDIPPAKTGSQREDDDWLQVLRKCFNQIPCLIMIQPPDTAIARLLGFHYRYRIKPAPFVRQQRLQTDACSSHMKTSTRSTWGLFLTVRHSTAVVKAVMCGWTSCAPFKKFTQKWNSIPMPLIEIQRVPGMPKERHELAAGQMFYPWLKEAALHAELEIFRNGVKVQDDDDINFPLNDGDVIRIFDQPKGGGLAGTLLNPLEHFNPIKFTQKILSSLMPQPNAGAASGNSKTSPNNSLKGQTNIARNGEARPDTYGTVRSFPDLIQESLFEYTNNLKYVTEMMNFGLGKYDYSSIRYSESNLGSMAGASYTIYQPGEVIPTVNEGYEFDDVDGQEVPGANESGDFPIETATATTVISGTYSGGQIAMQILKQSDFDYFIDLTLPHAVTFTINVTYPTASGSKTEDITLSANLIDANETNNGDLVSPIYYYNFIFNNLNGANASIITSATINTTKFILNDNEALVVGPFFSPVDSSQLWVHTQSALGGNSETNWRMTLWKVDEDNVQIPGTTQVFTYRQTTPHDSSSETFYRTDKITPTGGSGRYAISFQRTDNSSDASTLKVEEIHAVNVRSNVVHPADSIVRITVRATENATGSRERKYNALITRHTITYNLSTQSVDYTLRPSRSFADAVIHTWLVMGKQSESSIDIFELYSIAASLPDVRLGYFDYTFDDEDISLGSRVQTICDAATVTAFWDDGVLSFSRDEKKSNPVTVFNRANMTTEGYSLSYDMTLPGGFDGVEVEYRNPTTNKQD